MRSKQADKQKQNKKSYLVAREHVEQPAGLHGPHENLKAVERASAHELAAGIECHALELHRMRAGECAEVPVAHRVKRAHSSVQGRRHHDQAALRKLHAGNAPCVLSERDHTKARVGAPQLDLNSETNDDDDRKRRRKEGKKEGRRRRRR